MRTKSAITIHDVAAAAGVSVTTVSRVLNDKDDVAPETSERVREVIRELGYASSLAARSMRSRRTNVIGLIVPDLTQPYSLLVTKGVQRAAVTAGYDLLVYASALRHGASLGNREQQQVGLLNGSVTDGLIIVTPHASSYRTAYPLVAVDPHSENADFASVLSTNFRGVVAAMQYLLGLGHRRIGFVGGRPDLQSAIRRLEGYCHSLKSAGIAYDEEIIKVGNYETSSRGYVGRFNFKGVQQQQMIGDLSGGERNRVHLAKVLKSGGNVLLLDEPTNDLDIETLRALEEALLAFPGCAVVISHDRWFLDRIATHILAFEGDSQVVWFEGNYQEYTEDYKRRKGDEAAQPHRIRYKPLTG